MLAKLIKPNIQKINYTQLVLPLAGISTFQQEEDNQVLSQNSKEEIELKDDQSSLEIEIEIEKNILLSEAQKEADEIIKNAQQQAAKIIADAHTHVDEIECIAKEKGLQEAQAYINAQVIIEVEPLRAQFVQTFEELSVLREYLIEKTEHTLLELSIEIAKKVVQREVQVDREIVLSLARVALSRLHSRSNAIIHLHPDDYQYVMLHKEKLGNGRAVELTEDFSVGKGGCLIETPFGDVDARIEQQFAEIERGFLQ